MTKVLEFPIGLLNTGMVGVVAIEVLPNYNTKTFNKYF